MFRTLFWFFIVPLSVTSISSTFASSTEQAFKPDQYQNYLTCLALCGNLHTTRVNRTLMSGEQLADWVKDDAFEACDNFCQVREKYPIASKLESLAPPTDFDRLEVVCMERESLSPFKIRAKLNIPHQDDFPVNESILFVVETWRSVAEEGGVIKNSLAGRYFTFSSQFMTLYKFSQNPNRENLYVRVFPFTADGPAGKPLCSNAVSPRSLLNNMHKSLTLGHAQLTQIQINSTSHFLQWTAENELAPPECDQFLQLIMAQKIQTKTVNLDASHIIKIGELNENFTYQVKMSGLLAHQSKANADATSMIIIGGMHDESEDWNLKLDSYFGLLIMICLVSLMLLILICFFCCRARRQQNPSYTPNSVYPKDAQKQDQNDTRTEETVVVEQPSFIENSFIPYAPELMHTRLTGPGYPFQPKDENYKVLNQPRQLKYVFDSSMHRNNSTSTPTFPLTPPSEDFV